MAGLPTGWLEATRIEIARALSRRAEAGVRRPPLRLSPRPDEPLYSILARLTHRLGGPGRGELQQALLVADLPIYEDLPVGLGILADDGWLRMGADEALYRLTLFPYYVAFADTETRVAGTTAMAGVGPWPQQVIRSWHTDVPPIDRLRFCGACRARCWR